MGSYGGPEVISVARDARRPAVADGQLLIEVRAASLNPIDTAVRSGGMREMLPLTFPATLGGDFAGVVRDVGSSGGELGEGDEVYGQAGALLGGSGTLAEFALASAGFTARKPKTTDFVTAASLPLVGGSAVQAITEHLNVRRGQRILIHGAAGGVGSVALQIARHLGAHVIASVFPDDADYVRELGADEVIDAKNQRFETLVGDLDGVLDLVRGETAARSYAVLKRGGVLVSLTAQPDEARMKETGVTMIAQFTQPSTERLKKLAGFVDSGVIKPKVERVFPLDQAADAFRFFETDDPRGKVVVKV
jgi:NADPH:quinone reductase-like Zn-dependent oxidoreductase